MNATPAERLAARSIPQGECIVFTGGENGRGYGSIWVNRRQQLAHRVAWEIEHGPIPGDLTIDHTCETKRCIRTEHMQLVTRAENQRLRWVRWAERRAVNA